MAFLAVICIFKINWFLMINVVCVNVIDHIHGCTHKKKIVKNKFANITVYRHEFFKLNFNCVMLALCFCIKEMSVEYI